MFVRRRDTGCNMCGVPEWLIWGVSWVSTVAQAYEALERGTTEMQARGHPLSVQGLSWGWGIHGAFRELTASLSKLVPEPVALSLRGGGSWAVVPGDNHP